MSDSKQIVKDVKPKMLEASPSFHTNMAISFMDQQDCDCQFSLRDMHNHSHQRILGAHKVVLTAASSVFHTMFYGPLKETGVVKVKDVSYQAMKWLFWIIYQQKVVKMPAEYEHIPFYGRDIYMVAHKYHCKPALEQIRAIIIQRLTEFPGESLVWYEMSQMFHDPIIRSVAVNAFITKTNEVLISSDLPSSQPSTIEFICKQEQLNIKTEMDLVNALERFLRSNPRATLDDEHIIEAKRNIRFLTLTKKQIKDTEILTAEEKIEILYSYDTKEDVTAMQKLELSFSKLMRDKPRQSIRRTPRKRGRHASK